MTKFFEETTFSFLDLETDGMSSVDNQIIDIAVIQYRCHEEISRFSTLVNTNEDYIPWFIQNLTGITPSMLKGNPSFREISEDLATMLDGTVVVAHNASFDYSFISQNFKKHSVSAKMQKLCTVKLSRRFNKELRSHKLDNLIQLLELNVENRHRALDDTLVLVEYYKYILGKISEDEFEVLLKSLIS